MKKTVTLLFILSILTSCLTTSLPDPSVDNTGLMIIPMKLINETKVDISGLFRFTIRSLDTDYEQTFTYKPSNKNHKIFLEPGRYEMVQLDYVSFKNEKERSESDENSYKFDIYSAEIFVFPIQLFTEVIVKRNKIWRNLELRDISEEDMSEITLNINNMENSDLWSFR